MQNAERCEIKEMRQLSGEMTGKTQMFTQHRAREYACLFHPYLSLPGKEHNLREWIYQRLWPLRLCG